MHALHPALSHFTLGFVKIPQIIPLGFIKKEPIIPLGFIIKAPFISLGFIKSLQKSMAIHQKLLFACTLLNAYSP